MHPCTGNMYNNIGNVLRLQGRNDEALRMYQRAKDIFETVYGFENVSTAILYTNLGNLYYAQGQLEEALKMTKAL
jgi:superkiller protein 3